jgi:plastocyanin
MKLFNTGLAGTLFLSIIVHAADVSQFAIVIKNHHFDPPELKVPAGQKIKLVIDNQDPTPEEFDSHDLRREKIVPGHGKAIIWVGPLEAGTYRFVGEYHEDTAKGKLIVE